MILGIIPIDPFVQIHVAISLVAIVTGLVALPALAGGRWKGGWNAIFLFTTLLTSVTGFMFPFSGVTPAFIFGVLSLIALAIAYGALYGAIGGRRAPAIYAATAVFALYLNVFVLIVQSFQKLPPLQALAPTQSEPPFAVAQGLLLALMLLVGWKAARAASGVLNVRM